MRERTRRLLPLLVLPCAAALTRYATIVEGYSRDFEYVAHFGFASYHEQNRKDTFGPGHVLWSAWTFMPDQKLLVFKGDDWFKAYHDRTLSCVERASYASMNYTVPHGGFYGRASKVIDMMPALAAEPQLWYVALARCREWSPDLSKFPWMPSGIFMYYAFEFMNPSTDPAHPRGDHFSFDEQGSLLLHRIALGLYAALFLMAIGISLKAFCSMKGKLREKTRTSLSSFSSDSAMVAFASKVQLLVALMTLCIARHTLMVAHTTKFSADGLGFRWASGVSEAIDHSSNVLMALGLLWLSEGWTVTVANLAGCSRLLHLMVMFVLTAVYVAFFVVEVTYRDPAASYAPHEGVLSRGGLVPLRIILACWFAFNVLRMLNGNDTMSRERRQSTRSFYRLLLVTGTLWFVSLPAWHLVCLGVPPYARHKVMSALLFLSNWCMLCVLVLRGMTGFGKNSAESAVEMVPQITVVRRL